MSCWSGTAAELRGAGARLARTRCRPSDDEHALRIAADVAGVRAGRSRDGGLHVAVAGGHLDALVLALGDAGVAGPPAGAARQPAGEHVLRADERCGRASWRRTSWPSGSSRARDRAAAVDARARRARRATRRARRCVPRTQAPGAPTGREAAKLRSSRLRLLVVVCVARAVRVRGGAARRRAARPPMRCSASGCTRPASRSRSSCWLRRATGGFR